MPTSTPRDILLGGASASSGAGDPDALQVGAPGAGWKVMVGCWWMLVEDGWWMEVMDVDGRWWRLWWKVMMAGWRRLFNKNPWNLEDGDGTNPIGNGFVVMTLLGWLQTPMELGRWSLVLGCVRLVPTYSHCKWPFVRWVAQPQHHHGDHLVAVTSKELVLIPCTLIETHSGF